MTGSLNGHGGFRAGAGARRKPLLEIVRAGSFRAARHRGLLTSDASLLRFVLSAEDETPPREFRALCEVARVQFELLDEPDWSARRDELVREFARAVEERFGGSGA